MKVQRMLVPLSLLIVTISTGCGANGSPYGNSSDPVGAAQAYERSAQALYSQATLQAQQTVDAQTEIVRATREAERRTVDATATTQAAIQQTTESAFQATRNALDAQERQLSIDATSTAYARDSAATATADGINAQLTAVAIDAYYTQVTATAEAINRQSEREERTQLLTTFGGFTLVIVALAVMVALVWYFAPVLKARAAVIRRRHDESEPLLVTLERIVMPSRMFGPLLNVGSESAPVLAPPELQDRTTARAQLANVVSAARGGGRKRILHRNAPANRPNSPAIRVVEPGQVKPWIEDARAQLITEGVTDGNP